MRQKGTQKYQINSAKSSRQRVVKAKWKLGLVCFCPGKMGLGHWDWDLIIGNGKSVKTVETSLISRSRNVENMFQTPCLNWSLFIQLQPVQDLSPFPGHKMRFSGWRHAIPFMLRYTLALCEFAMVFRIGQKRHFFKCQTMQPGSGETHTNKRTHVNIKYN